MRFAISLPQRIPDGTFDPGAFRDYLQQAEDLGFHSAWTQEHALGTAPVLGPVETMTYAAACTTRLRLGCAVFVTPRRNPLHLAKSIATLDQLSRGRVETGVALGARTGLEAFGVTPDHLVTRFTEGLELMRACWSESRIDFDGRFWQVRDAAMEPKPFQKPYPPIWIGGHHPAALRRISRLGDGFFGAGGASTTQFAEQVRVLRTELTAIGRDPAAFPIAKRVYISLDDDPDRAFQRIRQPLESLYGRTDVAVSGTPDDCIRGLRAVAEAGADLVLLDTLQTTDQLQRLSEEVLPALSGRQRLRTRHDWVNPGS